MKFDKKPEETTDTAYMQQIGATSPQEARIIELLEIIAENTKK